MSAFTPKELAYLRQHRLGRLATVNAAGDLHVVPARYAYNPEMDAIEVGGAGMAGSKKYRDAQETGKAAYVIDDTAGLGNPRGLEVRGVAEAVPPHPETKELFRDGMIRIRPSRIVSWGIDTDARHPHSRRVG